MKTLWAELIQHHHVLCVVTQNLGEESVMYFFNTTFFGDGFLKISIFSSGPHAPSLYHSQLMLWDSFFFSVCLIIFFFVRLNYISIIIFRQGPLKLARRILRGTWWYFILVQPSTCNMFYKHMLKENILKSKCFKRKYCSSPAMGSVLSTHLQIP